MNECRYMYGGGTHSEIKLDGINPHDSQRLHLRQKIATLVFLCAMMPLSFSGCHKSGTDSSASQNLPQTSPDVTGTQTIKPQSDDTSSSSDAVLAAKDDTNDTQEAAEKNNEQAANAANAEISFSITGAYDLKKQTHIPVPDSMNIAVAENLKNHKDALTACFKLLENPDNPFLYFGLYMDIEINGDGHLVHTNITWEKRKFMPEQKFTSCINKNILSWTFPKQDQNQSKYRIYLYNYRDTVNQSNLVESERKRIEYNEFQTQDKDIVGMGACYRTQDGVEHCPEISAIARCSQNRCECVLTDYDSKRESQQYTQSIGPCSPSDPKDSDIRKVQYESSYIQFPAEELTVRKFCAVINNQVSDNCECIMSNGEYDSNDYLLLKPTDDQSFRALFVDCTNGHNLYN